VQLQLASDPRERPGVRDLSAACTELADQLAVFTENDVTSDRADAGLLTSTLLVVDQDAEPGTGRRSVPATRTPGNTQAINAEMDAHELVRRLEASLRLIVTGHTGMMRGGSDSSTRAAIAAIEKLGEAVPPAARQLAARLLDRATTTIGQLPSVDEIPRSRGGCPPPARTVKPSRCACPCQRALSCACSPDARTWTGDGHRRPAWTCRKSTAVPSWCGATAWSSYPGSLPRPSG